MQALHKEAEVERREACKSAASSSAPMSSKLLHTSDIAVIFDAMATLLLAVPLTECVLGIRRALEMEGSEEQGGSASSSSMSDFSVNKKAGGGEDAGSSSSASSPPTIVVIDAGVCGVSSLLAFEDRASLILRIDESPMPLHASDKAEGGSGGRGGMRAGAASMTTPVLCGKFAVTEVSRVRIKSADLCNSRVFSSLLSPLLMHTTTLIFVARFFVPLLRRLVKTDPIGRNIASMPSQEL